MKPIDKLPQIKKQEDKDLERFAHFLDQHGARKIIILDKPDETSQTNTETGKYDYLVEVDNLKLALEFTRLFEPQSHIIRHVQWGNIVAAFRKKLEDYLSTGLRLPFSGLWRIQIPQEFGASKPMSKNIAQKYFNALLNALKEGQKSIQINNTIFSLEKVVEQPDGDVYFSSSINAQFINAAANILEEIKRLLPRKNQQLNTKMATQSYLIIINKSALVSASDVTNAMAKFERIWQMKNIDKIYFEDSPQHFSLIFSRELLDAWLREKISANKEFLFVFQLWLPYLREQNPERSLSLFWGVLKNKKPYEKFPDPRVREEIIHIGEWLVEHDRSDESITLIEKFMDDPDPPEPDGYKGESIFNYHEQILKGEDPVLITSVRGHLAWLIQKLAMKKDNISISLDYTKRLLQYRNLYAKLQALIPLIEIAARRQWLEEVSQLKYAEFHDLVFDTLKEYSRYPAIANRLVHVFYYFKDLTTSEALEVLEYLKDAEESGTLYVYYAIFRERHYKNADGTDKRGFDSTSFKRQLEQVIEADDNLKLKSQIVWNFSSILKDGPSELQTCKPYIELFFQQSYQREIYDRLQMIIKECIDIDPDICITWFQQLLAKLSEFLNTYPEQARNIYLAHIEEIIEAVATNKPNEIIEIMKNLVKLWTLGVYIGNPRELFGVYKLIEKSDFRYTIKKEFLKLYQLMKDINPKLVEADWDSTNGK
jgi:hypothetical protein